MMKEDYEDRIKKQNAIYFNQEHPKAITLIEDEARTEAQKNAKYDWEARRRASYYRGLLDQCAKSLDLDVPPIKDSLTQDYPDLKKIPELVDKLVYKCIAAGLI